MRKKVEEAEVIETTEAIHVKHRPTSFAEVLGQKATVKSLESAMKSVSRPPHLPVHRATWDWQDYTGPAGCQSLPLRCGQHDRGRRRQQLRH